MLEIAGIDVRFDGVVALDAVSLTLPADQIVGVIGPNGAGKTTLFNAVCRFVTPVAGTITFRGESLLNVPAWRLRRPGGTVVPRPCDSRRCRTSRSSASLTEPTRFRLRCHTGCRSA